jgi:hypothetical protein
MRRWIESIQSAFMYSDWDDFHKYAPYNQSFWQGWSPISWGEREIQGVHSIQIHYIENSLNPYDYIRVVQFPIRSEQYETVKGWIKEQILKDY